MSNMLLITRPFFDPVTSYLYHWSQPIINLAKKKRLPIADLKNKRANRATVEGILKKRDPRLFVFNGHGNSKEICGQDNEILVESKNVNSLKNKVIYARSCSSGNHLGKEAIKKGAEAFIGYTNDFVLLRSNENTTKPLADPLAKEFLEPSNAIPLSLLKGHTAREAHNKSIDMLKQSIQRLASSTSVESYLIQFLVWNMANQICLGSGTARL